MTRLLLASSIALALSACATAPDKIAGIPNAGQCTAADRASLAELTTQQRKAREADIVGVVLIGVPVASIGRGKDRERQIAMLKGRCG
jgi:starvation-inducible outer membrane lipoprotein